MAASIPFRHAMYIVLGTLFIHSDAFHFLSPWKSCRQDSMKQQMVNIMSKDAAPEEGDGSTNRYGALGAFLSSSQAPLVVDLLNEETGPPAVNSFSQAAYEKNYLQQRKVIQEQFLEEDPLSVLEANNGVKDLPSRKLIQKKLTKFSRPDSSTGMIYPLEFTKGIRRSEIPGIAREVSSTEELKVHARSQNGEVLKEEKKLVRAESVKSVLGNHQPREVASITELTVYPRNSQGEVRNENKRVLTRHAFTKNGACLSPEASQTVDLVVQAKSMFGNSKNIAREVKSTDELKVYARDGFGEPILDKPRLVMPLSGAASVAASVLEKKSMVDVTRETQTKEELEVHRDDAQIDTIAQRGTSQKSKTKKLLATSPNAGMAEILDMNHSKTYSLSPSARVAASILRNSEAVHNDSSASHAMEPKRKGESYFVSSPSKAFPEIQAKSKPVLAKSLAAAMAATVLQTGVKEQLRKIDDSELVDKKVFFFRPDQAPSDVNPSKKSAVFVDNPFQYKQTLSPPEQNPSLAGSGQLYGLPTATFTKSLAPGLVEGPTTFRRKIFANSLTSAVTAKRGLSPGIFSRDTSPQKRIFARVTDEANDKVKRFLSPGMMEVDHPFHYKQAISSPENNPAQARTTGNPKKSLFVNPALQEKEPTQKRKKTLSRLHLDEPFQYKQAQSVPPSHENPANVKTPVVPVRYTMNQLSDPSQATVSFPNPTEGKAPRQNRSLIEDPNTLEEMVTDDSRTHLVTPIDGSMAKALAGPSPEDVYVHVSTGVLSVPGQMRSTDVASTKHLPTKQQPMVDSNLVSPQSVSMARVSAGPSPADVYVQVQSGLLTVPVRKPGRKTSMSKKKATINEEKVQTVPYTANSMVRATIRPSPEDVNVQVESGVLAVPIRSKSGRPMSPQPELNHQEEQKSLVSPEDNSMARASDDITRTGAYVQITSGVTSRPPKRSSVELFGSVPKMSGPGDTPLPNPSGIITFPDPRPQTTAPPGIAAPSSFGRQSSPFSKPSVAINPNDITYNSIVGRPKKKLVGNPAGSMAKAIEGPYTALLGEEPVKVKSDILPVNIRNNKPNRSKKSK
ncbi:hypothetical protein IV203_016588 [Nitzschia inconspicua]|uniref:Uncharacterized protein n=1 Tax=Nitzschia inconspicua TaxID=303405 RepID=A0A9K3KRP5_9STRA|nr:hypothetical protein IV203_016588 [Nitzschia inconspicua]